MGIKMLKKFAKYVSQNMLGMVGMSVYILADTYFISVAVGTDGITALNLVLPVYNLIFAVGAMMGVGSAIRLVIERNQKNPDADGYFFHALLWAFIVSLLFMFVGIFLPDKLIALLGGDAKIIAVGKNYTRIFMSFAPLFMWNYICNAFVRNDGNPSIAMAATLFSSLFNIVFDYVLMFPLGLSMEGAALATALSPVVGILTCCIHFRSEKCTIKLKPVLPSVRKIFFCCNILTQIPINSTVKDWDDILSKTDDIVLAFSWRMNKIANKFNLDCLKNLSHQFWYTYTHKIVKRVARVFLDNDKVITTRLHGHIFSCLLEIPNVVCDNSYGKNSSYAKLWTQNLNFVELDKSCLN